jgi:hypothetical protein
MEINRVIIKLLNGFHPHGSNSYLPEMEDLEQNPARCQTVIMQQPPIRTNNGRNPTQDTGHCDKMSRPPLSARSKHMQNVRVHKQADASASFHQHDCHQVQMLEIPSNEINKRFVVLTWIFVRVGWKTSAASSFIYWLGAEASTPSRRSTADVLRPQSAAESDQK